MANDTPIVPENDPRNTSKTEGDQIHAQGSQGFVNRPNAPVNQNFGTQYVVNSLDDISLSPEEMHSLLNKYRQHLLEETRYLKLEGIPPLPDEEFTSKIPLQRVYIHIQALEQRQSQELRRAEEQSLRSEEQEADKERQRLDIFDLISRLGEYLYRRGESVESSQRPAPIDPLEAIRKHRHLVLLGAPGAGKSTLLRYLAHQWAQTGNGKIALLVPLGAFALAYAQDRQLSLNEWAFHYAAPQDDQLRRALRQAAKAGNVFWLFDGLDETGDLREETSRLISQVATDTQVVVTSRPLNYRRTYLEHFDHFEALPLTTNDVEQFIHDWLTILAEQQNKTPEWIKECSDWLQKQLTDRPRIRALTQNPLLLTFLVILARHDPRQDLPTQRSELYAHYIQELFSAWEQRRQPNTLPLSESQYVRGIEAIAWYLHLSYFGHTERGKTTREEGSEVYAPNRASLQRWLAKVVQVDIPNSQFVNTEEMAGQIIDFWLRNGLIEEKKWQTSALITFRHLTFQEYGVAKVLHAAWQKNPTRTWRFLKPRLHHFAWREPLLLLAERFDPPAIAKLVRHLLRHPSPYDRTLQRDLFLAALLSKENGQAPARSIQQIVNRLRWHIQTHTHQFILFYLLLAMLSIIIGWSIGWLAGMPLWMISLVSLCGLALFIFATRQNRTARYVLALAMLPLLLTRKIQTDATNALAQLGVVAVDPLLVALKDEDSNVRCSAANALGQLSDGRAVDPLLIALRDKDSQVRISAAKALGQLSDGRAVDPLLVALRDEDTEVRISAAEALGQLKDERAVEPLLVTLRDKGDEMYSNAADAAKRLGEIAVDPASVALKDDISAMRNTANVLKQFRDGRPMHIPLVAQNYKNSEVRSSAAKALGELGDGRAVAPLLIALREKDNQVRWSAADALTRLGEVAVKLLLVFLTDEDSKVRWSAAEALGPLRDGRAVEPLLFALRDKNSDVRSSVAEALGQLRDQRAVEPLLNALKDSQVRWHATKALIQLGEIAVEPLLVALTDENSEVRSSAAEALEQLRDRRAIEPLLNALKDSQVRWRATKALIQLGEVAVAPLLVALRDEDSQVRISAAKALGQLKDERAVEPLLLALTDEDRYVRANVVKALGQLRDGRAVKPLLVSLKDEDNDIHMISAIALGQLGSEHAIEPILVALKDQDSNIRRIIVEALRQAGGNVIVEPFLVALKDEDSEVRWSAVRALVQLRDRRALEPLLVALRNENENVRRSAVNSLGELRNGHAVEPLLVALKDEDSEVRISAAKSLRELRDGRAVAPLMVALKDKSYLVCFCATEALGRMGDIALEPLLAALTNEDRQMRFAAARALEQLIGRYAVDWEYARLRKIAAALWWRLPMILRMGDKTIILLVGDENVISVFSAVVSRFPITVKIDDLLLPPDIDHKTRWLQLCRWFGAVLVAILALTIAAITGVLGNLLNEW